MCITALVGNTYHARVHYTKRVSGSDSERVEVDVDARPSDAVNLAVRFGCSIFVNRVRAGRSMSACQRRQLLLSTIN